MRGARSVTQLPALTGLRGLAALAVAAFHAVVLYTLLGPGWPGGPTAVVLTAGWMGVDFFFVLSGFLLALPLLAYRPGLSSGRFWRSYLSKRMTRIVPPYYVAIGLALLLGASTATLHDPARNLLAHALFLQNLDPAYAESINGVFWTLAIEFQFYLLLPVLARAFTGRGWAWSLAALWAVGLAARAAWFDAASDTSTFFAQANVLAFLPHFATGIAAARLYLDGHRIPMRPVAAVGAALAWFLLLSIVFHVPRGEIPGFEPLLGHEARMASDVLLRPLLSVGFAVIIFALVAGASRLRDLVESRPIAGLGEISYSLYLVHVPVGVLALRQVPVLAQHGFFAFLVTNLLVVLGAAVVFYGLVERPSLLLKDVLTSRRPTRSAPGGARPMARDGAIRALPAE